METTESKDLRSAVPVLTPKAGAGFYVQAITVFWTYVGAKIVLTVTSYVTDLFLVILLVAVLLLALKIAREIVYGWSIKNDGVIDEWERVPLIYLDIAFMGGFIIELALLIDLFTNVFLFDRPSSIIVFVFAIVFAIEVIVGLLANPSLVVGFSNLVYLVPERWRRSF